MSLTLNWDQVTALTRLGYIPKLQDNVFYSTPFLAWIRSREKSRELGKVLVAPLRTGMENGDWYSGTDQHDTTIRNPITAANFFAKNLIVSCSIDETEELEATTIDKVLDLIGERTAGAEDTVKYLLTAGFFNAATNPKAVTGLQFAVPMSSSGTLNTNSYLQSQTYGGIACGGSAVSSDTSGFWQSNVDTNSGTPYKTGSTGSFMQANDNPLAKMFKTIFLRCGRHPNLIVSNEGSWNDYHASLVKNERFERPQQNSDLAKSGFVSLMYRKATWLTDALAPRQTFGGTANVESVYALDDSAFDAYWDPRRKFYPEPWVKPYNQSTRIMYIKNRLELVFRERRSSGVIAVQDMN